MAPEIQGCHLSFQTAIQYTTVSGKRREKLCMEIRSGQKLPQRWLDRGCGIFLSRSLGAMDFSLDPKTTERSGVIGRKMGNSAAAAGNAFAGADSANFLRMSAGGGRLPPGAAGIRADNAYRHVWAVAPGQPDSVQFAGAGAVRAAVFDAAGRSRYRAPGAAAAKPAPAAGTNIAAVGPMAVADATDGRSFPVVDLEKTGGMLDVMVDLDSAGAGIGRCGLGLVPGQYP